MIRLIECAAMKAVFRLGLGVSAVLTAAVLQLGAQAPGTPPPAAKPRLVVLIAVDQFRGDYVQMYGAQWTQGLHALFANGAYFPNAAYPYLTTKTCAGHFTIGTGALPAKHGMIDNDWYDVKAHQYVACTDDALAINLGLGGAKAIEHHSAKRSLVPAYADELRRQQTLPARVVSMSAKARAALGLGGHGGPNTTIVWEEDLNGVWAASSGASRAVPIAASAYVKAHPISAWPDRVWDRVLPESAYQFDDKAPGEPLTDGVFPHSLIPPVRTSRPPTGFIELWDKTPLVDAYLGRFAEGLVEQMKLGQQAPTDMLAISFTGLDIAGHAFGPRSHEVQDTLARLDRTLGSLIATLDRLVGRNRYVLALSADHGVAEIPEQSNGAGGRYSLTAVGNAVERALDAEFGAADYIEAMSGNDIYFLPGVIGRIRSSPAAIKRVEEAVLSTNGLARVLWAADLASTTPTDDPLVARARKSYKAGRSGDLTFVVKPNWIVSSTTTGTTHGSPYDYDTHVPVVFFGAGIAPGRYPSAATPADVAPTLAALTGTKLPLADGRPLGDALAQPPR